VRPPWRYNYKCSAAGAVKIRCADAFIDARHGAGRLMVFSGFQTTFRMVSGLLRTMGIPYAELDGGNVRELDGAQQAFRMGRAPVLLVNASFYGAGMNLECATDVVFMHRMEPHMEEQVVGRAQRPGRTTRLTVWSLVFQNEQP
jgi:SNF2 family DNA or RNA helicase